MRHCNGADGAECFAGFGIVRLAGDRLDQMARARPARRCGLVAFRSAALEQVAVGPDGDIAVEVGTLEPEGRSGADAPGHDVIRRNRTSLQYLIDSSRVERAYATTGNRGRAQDRRVREAGARGIRLYGRCRK